MAIERATLKRRIITGLLCGLLFSTIMAFFDYFTNEPFLLFKFVFNFFFFGLFMGIAFRYSTKKDNK